MGTVLKILRQVNTETKKNARIEPAHKYYVWPLSKVFGLANRHFQWETISQPSRVRFYVSTVGHNAILPTFVLPAFGSSVRWIIARLQEARSSNVYRRPHTDRIHARYLIRFLERHRAMISLNVLWFMPLQLPPMIFFFSMTKTRTG